MNHLYVSDLDGTLLAPDGRLSEYTRLRLTELLEAGLPFTVATARGIFSVFDVFRGVPLKLPIIEYNGSMLTDPVTMRRLVVHPLAADILQHATELAAEAECSPFYSTLSPDDLDGYAMTLPTFNEGERWYQHVLREMNDPRIVTINDPRRIIDQHRIINITLINRAETMRVLEQSLIDRWGDRIQLHIFENLYSPGWHWINLHDGAATKRHGIASLLEHLGLTPDQLTVFGDESNDISMFGLAGRAIATGNAIEPLKAIATKVIGHNSEDSVVDFLAEDFKPRLPVS